MKKENLVIGNYYWFNYGFSCSYLMKIEYNDGKDVRGNRIYGGSSFEKISTHFMDPRSNNIKNLRLATAKEKLWLNACIKANKFIKQSSIMLKDDYNMY